MKILLFLESIEIFGKFAYCKYLTKRLKMTALELKRNVILRLNQTEDIEILTDIYNILADSNEDSVIIRLSDGHKNAIKIADEQIANGDFLSNEQADFEIEQWLNK